MEKMYAISLADYEVEVPTFVRTKEGKVEQVLQKRAVNVRDELSGMLRMPGMFTSLNEACEAIVIAREILSHDGDDLKLRSSDLKYIRKAMDKLVAVEHKPEEGKVALGGPLYEELMFRVYGAEEI